MAITWWASYCGNDTEYDAFWSENLTINTFNPDLSNCFQNTVLEWIACGTLLIPGPFYIWFLSKVENIYGWRDKGFLNCLKLVLAVCVVLLALLNLVYATVDDNRAPVQIVSPITIGLTYLFAAYVIHYEFKKAVHTSGMMFTFFFCSIILGIVSFRSTIIQYPLKTKGTFYSITFFMEFAMLVALFIVVNVVDKRAFHPSIRRKLHHWSDTKASEKTPLLGDNAKHDTKEEENIESRTSRESPELTSSFLMVFSKFWLTRFIYEGCRKHLEFEDVYKLPEWLTCDCMLPSFLESWWKEELKLKKERQEKKDCLHTLKPSRLNEEGGAWPLIKAITISTGWSYGIAIIYRIVTMIIIYFNPIILGVFLQLLESKDVYPWKLVFLAVAMFVSSAAHSFLVQRYCYWAFIWGIQMRTVVTAAVYRKALKLSSAGRRQTTIGEIVNLMAVDSQRLQDIPLYLTAVWTTPILLLITTGLLYYSIGPASLGGVSLMVIILIPVNGIYVANKIKELQIHQMKLKDERVKIANEVLIGMKVLKLYGWEPSFQGKIEGIRENELSYLKQANYLNAGSSMLWNTSTYVVSMLIFITYLYVSPDNLLTPHSAFVTTALVNTLNFPLSFMPAGVMYLGQTWIALKRIQSFLMMDELTEDATQINPNLDAAVKITDGVFSWGESEQPSLRINDLVIPEGKIVAVVGQVGSGKSSLMSALLGEMVKLSGDVTIKSPVAYVPQQAWIQNDTIRGNICFSKPYKDDKYKKVLEVCALEPDIKIMSDGDLTEIGERGINLSGGQKQRVSLARAVYQNKKIYLFDDPLSAVDAHVGKHLFESVIGPKGMLQEKTRILVTHGITYLPHVDEVIVLQNGVVSEQGTYEELLNNDGPFSEFLKDYMAEQDEEDLDKELKQLPEEFRKKVVANWSETDSDISRPSRKRKTARHRLTSGAGNKSQRASETQSKISKERIVPGKLIKEETSETGTVKWNVIKVFMQAAGPFTAVWSILFHILFLGTLVAGNVWLSEWTNDGVELNATDARALTDYRCGVYGGVIVLQLITSGIASFGVAVGSVAASRVLHRDLISRVLRAPMAFFDTTPLGRILNRISRDIDLVDFNIPLMLRQWFYQVVPLLATAIIISYSTPIFLVAVVPIAIIYALLMKVYIATVRQLRRIDSVRRSPIFVHFDESVVGSTSIRAYQQMDRFIRKSDVLTDDSQRAHYVYVVATRWLGNVLESLGGLVVLLASILVVIQRDSLSSGLAGMSVSISLQASLYLNFYVRASADLETYMVSVERVKEYSAIETEAPWRIKETEPKAEWPDRGVVRYDQYKTRYRPGLDLVLKGLTCEIKGGEKVGVVGRTGAGKSSLALSLFRIIESVSGQIFIDGLDISTLGLLDLRSNLTIIPQDPVIFSGTLRSNLDPFGVHSDSEVWTALDHAHLKTFVQNTMEGVDYECGENGEALSVGQRQLVCMARALLRNSKVLVLDEATAAIDLETDHLIQKTIRTAFSDRTVITVAHRLNTVLDYDRVMVMAEGNIAEFDTPTNLLAQEDSLFKAMIRDAGL